MKKNERRGANASTSSPACEPELDVREAVRERERELLRGRRARFADVVAGDRDRVPLRHLRSCRTSIVSRTSRNDGRGGKMNSFCAWYSLRMSFWSVPPSCARGTPGRFRVGDEHREHDRGGTVDRHRRRDRRRGRCRGRGLRRRRACRRRHRTCRPRRARARRRSRDPSASGGRTRSRARRRRRRAGRGNGGSCRPRCRSPRTCASSTASTGTSTRTGRACTGTGPGTRRRPVRRPGRPGRPTSWRSRRRDAVRRRSPLANVPGCWSRLHDRALAVTAASRH